MQLYMAEFSPPVRAVLLCAKALNLNLEHKPINLESGDHLKEEFIKINPQHTVPTLVDGDFVLGDSHAIMAYLIGKTKQFALYPQDVATRALVDQRLHFDSGNVFCNLRAMVAAMIFKKPLEEAVTERVLTAYDYLDKFLTGNEWVAGNCLTIADFSLLTSITSLNELIPIDQVKFANVHKWLDRCKALEYYAINENGLEKFKALIEMLKKRT